MSSAANLDVEAVRQRLAAAGQEHVLKFFAELDATQQQNLLRTLADINIEQIAPDFQRAMAVNADAKLDEFMEPLPAQSVAHVSLAEPSTQMLAWRKDGLAAIASGKVACVLLAGGQGTRLGSNNPKGMYDVGLPSHRSLFEIQALRLRRLQHVAAPAGGPDAVIPWYIMTSDATHAATVAYFESKGYFGLSKDNVKFFPQGCLPALDLVGKMMMESKGSLVLSPDGNGGLYAALQRHGMVADMVARGIEHIHAYCVDNILVRIADPVFVGYCASVGAPVGAVVVPKAAPTEKVGVLCVCHGAFKVVEYSEITSTTAHRRGPDGSLLFGAGNICNHYFTLDFLRSCCARSGELPPHVARKKIATIDSDGCSVIPDDVNGIKLEKFVFDVFGFSARMAVLEMARAEVFAPLKNARDADCPATCRRDLLAQHRQALLRAGATFASEDAECELSPLVCYDLFDLPKTSRVFAGQVAVEEVAEMA